MRKRVLGALVGHGMQALGKGIAKKHRGSAAQKGTFDPAKAIPMPRPMPGGIPPKRPSLKKKGGVSARGLGGMAKQFALDAAKTQVKKAGDHIKEKAKGALKNQGKKMLYDLSGIKLR